MICSWFTEKPTLKTSYPAIQMDYSNTALTYHNPPLIFRMNYSKQWMNEQPVNFSHHTQIQITTSFSSVNVNFSKLIGALLHNIWTAVGKIGITGIIAYKLGLYLTEFTSRVWQYLEVKSSIALFLVLIWSDIIDAWGTDALCQFLKRKNQSMMYWWWQIQRRGKVKKVRVIEHM